MELQILAKQLQACSQRKQSFIVQFLLLASISSRKGECLRSSGEESGQWGRSQEQRHTLLLGYVGVSYVEHSLISKNYSQLCPSSQGPNPGTTSRPCFAARAPFPRQGRVAEMEQIPIAQGSASVLLPEAPQAQSHQKAPCTWICCSCAPSLPSLLCCLSTASRDIISSPQG